MNRAPDLFSDKMCAHCGINPGPDQRNEHLWNGFRDCDTGQLVCNDCKEDHYEKKKRTEFAGMYSERPVYANGYPDL